MCINLKKELRADTTGPQNLNRGVGLAGNSILPLPKRGLGEDRLIRTNSSRLGRALVQKGSTKFSSRKSLRKRSRISIILGKKDHSRQQMEQGVLDAVTSRNQTDLSKLRGSPY